MTGTGVESLGIVVVGGATSSLGTALAAGLRGRGAEVVVTARAPEAGSDAVPVDVTDERSVETGLRIAVERLGRVDAVLNASGVTKQVPTIDLGIEEWRRVIDVNLTGSFLVARAAGRLMLGQDATETGRGSIVLVSSLCAVAGCDEVAAYAAAKAGVLGLTRSLASEWGTRGVRVNAIIPGVFPTPMNRSRIEGRPRGTNTLVRTPLGRFGHPDELVGAAAYLCGRDSSFVTGTELVVDGGFLAAGITERTASDG